ncbi:hypothetical protein ARMSODRAFT_1020623 [Armillaria solidipes]|uniref:Uncharacterized protein n=1 Tax=Armillaria solidipes TaxID=1076256 RepID=A0A2H3BSQ6_9AGAR|nr:hypothetical protein ARMSODRAFT_1020623 [Armillaria solidipes]
MATQTDIPSDLTDDYKVYIFQTLDAQVNSTILYALLHGIYTGILAVTLWNIFINKCWPIRRATVFVIILLHALITISFADKWTFIRSAFIENGQSFWTVWVQLNGPAQAVSWETGIAASISTILADLYMIWCCWMIWGQRWLVILLPILSLISATVSKIMDVYHEYFDILNELFPTLYISFVLATTLWCTLFILYRILTIAGVRRGEEGRLRVYHRFIEVLVESSALYSISLALYLAFVIRGDLSSVCYLDIIATIAKGIAPTLLVGRITAGHRAHPDDSWQGSVIASASIRSHSQEHSRTSSQENGTTSLVLDGDLEAQRESGVREPSPPFFPGAGAQSQGVVTLPNFENFPLYHLVDAEGSIRASL